MDFLWSLFEPFVLMIQKGVEFIHGILESSAGIESYGLSIIILTIDGTTMGIIVDNVRQVVDIDLDDVHPIPVRQRKKLLTGMLNMSDGTVAMAFDCEALMNVQM